MIGPYELCPETKRRHCHFWASFERKQSLSVIGREFACHVEVAKGNFKSVLAYCCKNGDPVLMLEPKQGERSDLRG